jgi:ssRNA-specific RNase YbeY (16S rRNA maturation enzyme)
VYRTDKRLMPAATAFVEFMDSEGSRLIEAQVGNQASPTSVLSFHSEAVTPSSVTKALTL